MAPETPTSTAPRPDGEQVPPPTADAITPRWAVRAEISDATGGTRETTLVSALEDLGDATVAALNVLTADLEGTDEIITHLDVFEPRTISDEPSSGPFPGAFRIPAGGLAALLGVGGPCGCGQCRDEDAPANGEDEPTAGTAVPADEA